MPLRYERIAYCRDNINGDYNRIEITKYEYGVDGIRTSAEHEIYEDGELKSKTRTEYLNDSKSLTDYSQVLRQTEYDAEGNIIKETSYIIGHQRISQTVTINGQKTTHYFTFDGHGSTRVLLDATTVIVQLYSYDAYGNAIGFIVNGALTEFLYSSEQFDSKINQQYLRARYYNPTIGTFNRLDPFFGNLTDPLSLHNYLYVHSDPVNNYDPSGEFSVGGTISSVAICTGIASLGINVFAGVKNALYGKSIFPDASLIGISGTVYYDPNIDLQNFLPTFYDHIGSVLYATMNPTNQTSLAKFFINFHKITHDKKFIHNNAGEQALKQFKNVQNHQIPIAIGFTFDLELVTTATDLKQGIFLSFGVTSYTNWAPHPRRIFGSISAHAGSIWNLQTIDGYRGFYTNLGIQFGAGIITAGVNYFYSQENPNTYGVSTGIGLSLGVPADSVSVGGTVGFAKELWISENTDVSLMEPYYYMSPFYGPALAIKAFQNAKK
jgi:RHS repeat-associated protein